MAHRRSLGCPPPDFLLRLVALANFMRLSLKERRTRNRVRRSVAGNPGRDDKKERVVVRRGPLPRDRAVVRAGNPLATALSFSNRSLLTTTRSFLSSRVLDGPAAHLRR